MMVGRMGWWYTTTAMPYGKAFTRQRKMLDDYLNLKMVLGYDHFVHRETKTLLQLLMDNPEDYDAVFGR
jgi:hypothetical protein